MIDIDSARKNRDVRMDKVEDVVKKVNKLPNCIANRLAGLTFDDMTAAERQIADLLGREGYLYFDEHGDCREI